MQKRGMLTDEIKQKSMELLGYEINTTELRLMPYIQYLMMNDQHIESRKINHEERDILSKWKKSGYIGNGIASKLTITKKFWGAICEICFIGYVDIE